MPEYSIYKDIAERTGGDIYVGVVGPVRSGKSTFIKRFMEAVVLPNIGEGYSRERARDELPQSAAGKTVMTTEPKFIPEEAVPVVLDNNAQMRVRMIDCVGYLIPEAMGAVENGQPRMVRTPWQEEPMPFVQAAETGTRKVITDHSTIGMLVTTDGSIGEIPRESFVEAEERIVRELKEIGKPFAIILNSATPSAGSSLSLAYELEEKYGVPVALVSCLELDAEDIRHILALVLEEFPVAEVTLRLPEWTTALDESHRIRASLRATLAHCADQVHRMGDVKAAFEGMQENEYVSAARIERIDLGTGRAEVSLTMEDGLYYSVISELTGLEGTTTTFQVAPDRITLRREGTLNSEMIFQEGQKHVSLYETPYGELSVDIQTSALRHNLSERGGLLEIKYSIAVEHTVTGRNSFKIRVKRKN